jgi:hypothetical protein
VRNINTTGGAEAWVDGEILYYNPAVTGGLTKTLPSAPNPKVQVCAVVHAASNGSLFIRPTFGGVLGQYEGDVQVTSPANGQLLIRDQTAGKWVNATLTDGTGISVTEGAGTVTVTNTAPDQTVVLTGGTGISTSGTYPNFTITNTAPSSGGTVTSVTGTSPVVSSGGNTPAISLAASYGDTQNPYASKTANFVLAAPNGSAGAPTFRAIIAADIPTLNQNTTGTASNVTGTIAIINGGTGQTTRQAAMDALAGSTTSGQYLRGNGTDVVMSAIQAADVPTLNQNTTGTAANVTGTVAVANGGTGLTSLTANRIPYGNGTSAFNSSSTFVFDGNNLGINTSSPAYPLDIVSNSANAVGISLRGQATNIGIASFWSNDGTTRYSQIRSASDELRIQAISAIPLTIYTSNTERMRIDSSGRLLINNVTTSAYFDGKLNVSDSNIPFCSKATTTGAFASSMWNSATTGDNAFIIFGTETSFTQRGSITYNRTAGLTAYNTTSDYRAKDIISPVLNSGEIIDSVPVYMGKMKDATQARPMFIAHETPDYAHTGEKDAVDKDGNPVYQQIDASSLVPVLWAEIQLLRKRVAQLESK